MIPKTCLWHPHYSSKRDIFQEGRRRRRRRITWNNTGNLQQIKYTYILRWWSTPPEGICLVCQWQSSSVDLPAIGSNLALAPGEDSDLAHLHYGSRELPLEALVVAREPLHLRRRALRGKEGLVRGEQPSVLQDAPVVMVVEPLRAFRVHRHRVVAARRALLPQRLCVLLIQRLVYLVQPVGEGVTVRDPDRVRSCTRVEAIYLRSLCVRIWLCSESRELLNYYLKEWSCHFGSTPWRWTT